MDPVTPPTITTEPAAPTSPIQPAPQYIPEKPNFFKTKKGLLISIGVILLLGILGVLVWIFSMSQNTAPAPQTNNNQQEQEQSQDVKSYPKFQFTYQNPQAFPPAKSTLMTYQIKDSFSDSEISSFGAQFGFEKPDSVKDGLVHYADFKNPASRGYLTLDTVTGGFDYQNMAQNNKIDSANVKQGALNFLKGIGLADNLISCDITYNLSTLPDVTYVECHRSWEALGAPLLNLPGVLNIPSSTPLSTLQLGYNSTPLENPAIINVSTGQNGVNRPSDFNTATFAIAPDGTILSITSNMRWVMPGKEENLITPAQAFETLKQDEADQTVAIPAGTGEFDWNKVFPTEGVTGQNASINGFELVYVENELSQKQTAYIPTYLFRGSVTTNTGYQINFVQTVPATTSSTSQSVSEGSAKKNLQLQTFQLSPTITRTPTIKTTTAPRPTSAPFDCSIDANIADTGIRGYTQPITKFTVNINGAPVQLASLESYPNTFFINQQIQNSDKEKYKMELYRLIGEQIAWNYKNGKEPSIVELPADTPSGYIQDAVAYATAKGVYDSLINNSNAIINPQLPTLIATTALSLSPNYAANPCYLTGLSPTIFVYSINNTKFEIKPAYTVKTEPMLTNFAWIFNADKNGNLTFNNTANEYLYYEFNPQKVVFKTQNKGFVLNINDIKPFAPKLAKEMKLNSKESERLLFELELAVKDLPKSTEYIKLSLIPAEKLNKKLPLSVSPKPTHTNRYHFILSQADKNDKSERPSIPAVKRGESTLVEIGASTL